MHELERGSIKELYKLLSLWYFTDNRGTILAVWNVFIRLKLSRESGRVGKRGVGGQRELFGIKQCSY